MSWLPENIAASTTPHKNTVLLSRRKKTFALEGGDGTMGAFDIRERLAARHRIANFQFPMQTDTTQGHKRAR